MYMHIYLYICLNTKIYYFSVFKWGVWEGKNCILYRFHLGFKLAQEMFYNGSDVQSTFMDLRTVPGWYLFCSPGVWRSGP